MKIRFRLIHRGERGSTFYCVDSETGQRFSLKTKDRDTAEQIVLAKNQALRQPTLNLQIAKAYLAGTDSGVATRTWQAALNALVETKHGSTKERWVRAAKDKALEGLLNRVIIETQAESLLGALKVGTVSTNVHLRKLHNFCLSMNWLPWPLIPKRLWSEIQFRPKRAITWEEHQLIVGREQNPERKDFYELCWHLGGSQSDIANLEAEHIDWENRVVGYARKKIGSLAFIHFGPEIEHVLRRRPKLGLLFPYLQRVRPGDRATEFKQRCHGLGIQGVTLHSYRYAWAERARKAGYPERFAQEAPNTDVFIAPSGVLIVCLELSGMQPGDFQISTERNKLRITGQRPTSGVATAQTTLVHEINAGPFDCVLENPTRFRTPPCFVYLRERLASHHRSSSDEPLIPKSCSLVWALLDTPPPSRRNLVSQQSLSRCIGNCFRLCQIHTRKRSR